MATINPNNVLKIKECDKNIKNKFSLKWFEKIGTVNVGKIETNVTIGEDFVKIDIPGQASCKLGNKQINYGSRGFIALEDHAKSTKHTDLLKSSVSTHRIDTMIKQYSVEGPSNESGGQGSETTQTPPVVPMCDRISNAEATVLAVVAEHGMPLSCTPTLVSLAKTLAQDSKALSEIKLDRTAAAYKTKYGLAESFHQKLVAKLRICPFSLNLDEATSSNKKKS
ncbi:hypothetical protein MAR_014608 [Mya arenaria]|uniref:Uncharacterized protein n=1 Tax=Mya arenaria TaxID=6604 RepID=A0ABY7G5W4_MYAAR|nr:uncharacterized protein LOC128220775 isoform X2 [Mya arenaria]WAR28904.1 hypothetical protein MAR_014608 [Mya arenaria]